MGGPFVRLLEQDGADATASYTTDRDTTRVSLVGLQVAGFPNLFTIAWSGSLSVLSNMPVAIEQHAGSITDCIAHMRAHGLSQFETTEDALEGWVARVNEVADATLLPHTRHSSYSGANVPG